MIQGSPQALNQLAQLYGLQLSYQDVAGRNRPAKPDVLLEVLQALGAPVSRGQDFGAAIHHRRRQIARRGLDPVIVFWGGVGEMDITFPAKNIPKVLEGRVLLEQGEQKNFLLKSSQIKKSETFLIGKQSWIRQTHRFPFRLSYGYHRLELFHQSNQWSAWLLAAPAKAFQFGGPKRWGCFVPLYGLKTQRNLGSGDYSDLKVLQNWIETQGGRVLATLPLLPTFLDKPLDPSPYAPVTRLFWNEFFLDPLGLPELEISPSAQKILSSKHFEKKAKSFRLGSFVDYLGVMALKRKLLEAIAGDFFRKFPHGNTDLNAFIKKTPLVKKYAAFRAVREKLSLNWREWPERLKDGNISPRDYDPEVYRTFLFSQWKAHEQVEALNHSRGRNKAALYLDLPLGVHPDGFDVWKHPNLFVQGVTGGAPPDPFFTRGQDWGFPPLHPEADRLQGYPYLRACLKHHLFTGGILRIDHIMGFNRLFWIPKGRPASQGLYVRYPFEDFYAMLCLESRRSRTVIAGEDLGTVPPEVPKMMSRRGIYRLYVVQYELESERPEVLPGPTSGMIASVNTHDMAPLAGYWKGGDIQARKKLGLLSSKEFNQEELRRKKVKSKLLGFLKRDRRLQGKGTLANVSNAINRFLSTSDAAVVLFNLEDFWLETRFQNMPGAGPAFHNWKRKLKNSFEKFCQDPVLLGKIQKIDKNRKKKQ